MRLTRREGVMRLPKLTTVFLFFLMLSANANAQAQRMALALGDYIANAGSEVIMRAFCIDPEREAPISNTIFSNGFGAPNSVRIEYQGRSYSPSEAMAQGIGEFLGSDMSGVRFHPKVPGEVRITVNDLFVFADRN